MSLLVNRDGFKVYLIDEVGEFNKIRKTLEKPVAETIAKVSMQRSVDQILDSWGSKISVKHRGFGLFIGVQDHKITAITTTELQIDINNILRCTMLFKYFKRNGLRQIIKYGLPIIEQWAKNRYCMIVQFPTNRSIKATSRLLEGGGFRTADTWFEKEI